MKMGESDGKVMIKMGMQDTVFASSTILKFVADAKNPWPYISAKRRELLFRWRMQYGDKTKPKIKVYFLINENDAITIMHPRLLGEFILNEDVADNPLEFLNSFLEAYEFREKMISKEKELKSQQPEEKKVEKLEFKFNKGGFSLYSR